MGPDSVPGVGDEEASATIVGCAVGIGGATGVFVALIGVEVGAGGCGVSVAALAGTCDVALGEGTCGVAVAISVGTVVALSGVAVTRGVAVTVGAGAVGVEDGRAWVAVALGTAS